MSALGQKRTLFCAGLGVSKESAFSQKRTLVVTPTYVQKADISETRAKLSIPVNRYEEPGRRMATALGSAKKGPGGKPPGLSHDSEDYAITPRGDCGGR